MKNHDILQVQYSDTISENDLFNGETIYINQIFLIDDTDNFTEKFYESTINQYFSEMIHIYVNVQSAFDSILNFGKEIINNPDVFDTPNILNKINNIDDINYEYTLHPKDYQKIVVSWIETNFYPYANFSNNHFVINFILDATKCYTIYEIHKWLIKITKNIDNILEKPKKHRELLNVKKLLDFLNFDTILLNINLQKTISNLPEDYIPSEDYEFYINFFYNKLNKENIIKYCEVVRRNLIGYIATIINEDATNYCINKQRPFYEPNKSQYRNIETAYSLIGIVYNKILSCLSVNESAFNRRICKNKDCNNEFIKIGRREWCSTPECQRARNREKQKKK